MRDYERYYDENKRLRDDLNLIRSEKDTALSELKRLKTMFQERTQELQDEYNLKLAHAENQLLEMRERNQMNEERAYEIMMMQEKIVEKWKNEHRMTVSHYEKSMKMAKTEIKHLNEK